MNNYVYKIIDYLVEYVQSSYKLTDTSRRYMDVIIDYFIVLMKNDTSYCTQYY